MGQKPDKNLNFVAEAVLGKMEGPVGFGLEFPPWCPGVHGKKTSRCRCR